MDDKIPVIAIFGPTASGKSDLAVRVCEKLGGEVVTADSMQVYKFMDIGTAKPDKEEMRGIPHHMTDVVLPTQNYSLSDYVRDAGKAIADIAAAGKIPVIAGGTGLYIDTLIDNTDLSTADRDDNLRKELYEYAKLNGNKALKELLKDIDIKSYESIHENNVKRVVRAIEFYKTTGVKQSEHIESSKRESPYIAKKFCIETERDVLYDRINKRADKMIDKGLIDEVSAILEMGVTEQNTSMQGIGYKEFIPYLNGEKKLDECVDTVKRETRRYAKRQITWFKREGNTTKISGDIESFIKNYK